MLWIFIILLVSATKITKAQIELNISKCPFEFLVGEDVDGCNGIKDHLHDTTDLLIKSICPYQSPFINFDRAEEQSGPSNFNGEIKWLQSKSLVKFIKNIIENAGIQITGKKDEEFIGKRIQKVAYKSCRLINQNGTYTKLNRMKGTYRLTFKTSLGKLLQNASNKYGKTNYPYLLPSYSIPKELNLFKQYLNKNKRNKIMEKWIMKPSGLARAKNVQIVIIPKQVDKYRQKVYKRTSTAQKYISQPMLYKGRKVVSRVYVYITSRIPLSIYILKEGHSFIAFQNYTNSIKEINNQCIHIPLQSGIIDGTKTCRNIESKSIKTPNELDEKYAMNTLEYFTYISSEYGVNITQLWSKIEDLVLKTMLLVTESAYNKEKKCLPFTYNSYGELSFEYIVDRIGNPLLIEVNEQFSLFVTNQSFRLKNNLIKKGMTLGGFQPPPSYLKKYGLPPSLSYDYKEKIQEIESKIEIVENMRSSTTRENVLKYILDNLTEWDIRELLFAEDELLRSVGLKRLFPTRLTLEPYEKYFKTKIGKYSLLLQEAWEKQYGGMNRTKAIQFIRNKCSILV